MTRTSDADRRSRRRVDDGRRSPGQSCPYKAGGTTVRPLSHDGFASSQKALAARQMRRAFVVTRQRHRQQRHYFSIGHTMRWRSKPFTKIAGIGRAGQTCSQAPQPMQAPLSTTGKPSTMCIAPTGHLREHAVHSTPSVRMQRSFFHIAWPMWTFFRSSRGIQLIAPVGQTCPQA